MRAAHIAVALLVVAGSIGSAQTQDTTAAVAAADEGSSGFEFRIGGRYLSSAERHMHLQEKANTATGNVQGGEGLLRGGAIGISARYTEARFAPGAESLSAA